MPARKVANEANKISVTLDIKDRRELDRLATERKRSVAFIVREAVAEYLAKHGVAVGKTV